MATTANSLCKPSAWVIGSKVVIQEFDINKGIMHKYDYTCGKSMRIPRTEEEWAAVKETDAILAYMVAGRIRRKED